MALNASGPPGDGCHHRLRGGQTFGAFSYPDATTTSKGIVQIDPVGGLAVAAGVASLAATGVVAGTYPKVTVDAKGRVTGGTTLVSGDLPAHTHVAGDVSSGAFGVPRGGTGITTYALGDLLYCSAADTLAKLAGNITTTRKFLRQTGTGSASAAPAWDTLLAGDLPGAHARGTRRHQPGHGPGGKGGRRATRMRKAKLPTSSPIWRQRWPGRPNFTTAGRS